MLSCRNRASISTRKELQKELLGIEDEKKEDAEKIKKKRKSGQQLMDGFLDDDDDIETSDESEYQFCRVFECRNPVQFCFSLRKLKRKVFFSS